MSKSYAGGVRAPPSEYILGELRRNLPVRGHEGQTHVGSRW